MAGLVAITPAAAAVTPVGAVVLGGVAGSVCAFAIGLKDHLGFDDSLDVVGVHLVGGVAGTLGIGFLASSATSAGVDGLLYGGGPAQLGRQGVAVLAVVGFSFGVTWLLGAALDRTMGFRVGAQVERDGIDRHEHGATAYDLAVAVLEGVARTGQDPTLEDELAAYAQQGREGGAAADR